MFEKVNPSHPDKVADRIAGALVDLAYAKEDRPRIAVEVLLGHGKCFIIAETSVKLFQREVEETVNRISEQRMRTTYIEAPQDPHLAKNQSEEIRCGDNGIFRGVPMTHQQKWLTRIAKNIYEQYPYDGKYIVDFDEEMGKNVVTICQSNAKAEELLGFALCSKINPIGDWTGGPAVDAGATNRKLGSDMGDAVTGGGLHGKDLSKADVSVNIYAHIIAQKVGKPIELSCSIGDEIVDGIPYREIVEIAEDYIKNDVGGFEKFAEWGLIR